MALITLKGFIATEQSRLATTCSLSLEEEILLEFDVKRLEALPIRLHGKAMDYAEKVVDDILANRIHITKGVME